MKQITCEMCGSTDFVKTEGMLVCQACGLKYTVEEAKKLLIEGTVEVTGTVKVDTTGDVENLLSLAKTALSAKNYAEAEKYATRVLEIAVDNAEAWLIKGEAVGHQSVYPNIRAAEAVECYTSYCTHAGEAIDRAILARKCTDLARLTGKAYGDKYAKELNVIGTGQKPTHVEIEFAFIDAHKELSKIFAKLMVSAGCEDDIQKALDNLVQPVRNVLLNAHTKLIIFDDGSSGMLSRFTSFLERELPIIIERAESYVQREISSARRIRMTQYWRAHADEKARLDAERNGLQSQLTAVEEEIDGVPTAEVEQCEQTISALNEKLSGLGIFKGKEKAQVREEIAQATRQLEQAQASYDSAVASLGKRQEEIELKLKAVEAELDGTSTTRNYNA